MAGPAGATMKLAMTMTTEPDATDAAPADPPRVPSAVTPRPATSLDSEGVPGVPIPAPTADGQWRLNVLGQVELCYDGQPVQVTGATRTLLAMLARNPGEEISTASIVAGMWGSAPPEDAEKEVASHVSKLRRALTVVAPQASPTGVVVTLPQGYILAIQPSNADTLAFERLLADGRRALQVGQAGLAIARLDAALALWRGPAYADFGDHAIVRTEAARLEELRLAAVAAVAQARLAAAAPGVRPRPVLPEALAGTVPTCVGRDEEIGWLLSSLDLAATRRAQARLIVGSAGIGKSRLIAAVAQRAAGRGALVRLWRGGAIGLSLLDPEPDRLGLIVVEDLDQAPHEDVTRVADFLRSAQTRPVAVLITCRDPVRVGDLMGLPKLSLGALDEQGVADIVRIYAPTTSTAAAASAMISAGGVPARVHRAASEWAFARAGRRIDRAVADAAEPNRRLGHLRDEVIAGVHDLAHVRAQAKPLRPVTRELVAEPYPGLRPLTAADAEVFHGRERLVAELVAALVRAPLLAVVGGVGTGKSSAVRAGLLPALAAGVLPDSAHWRQVVVTPAALAGDAGTLADLLARAEATFVDSPVVTDDPLDAVFAEPDVPDFDTGDSTEDDSGDPEPAALVAAPAEPPVRPVLLVVDQFEEAYTALDPAARAEFLTTMVATAGSGRVILTVRSDFYGRCSDHPELARLVTANSILVPPMDPAELRQAIEAPAAAAGLSLEDGLVDQLVGDAGRVVGSLAHLAVTLRAVWALRAGSVLTVDAYRAGGPVGAALSNLGERALSALATDGDREQAARILVSLTATVDGRLVRRRAPLAGFASVPALWQLAEHGLLTVHDPDDADAHSPAAGQTVEVVHEALVEHWPRLRTALADEAAERSLRRHLSATAQAWAQRDRDAASLYRGARLAAALDLARSRPAELSTAEHDFLGASQRVVLATEIRRKRRVTLLWRWLFACVAVAVLAVAVAAVAVVLEARASSASAQAEAGKLAAAALSVPDPRQALLLAVAASRVDGGGTAAIQAVLQRFPDLMATGPADVTALALSPDGRSVAAGSAAGPVWLYPADTLAHPTRLDSGAPGPVTGAAFTPDGRRLATWGGPATATAPASVVVWDLASQRPAGPAFGEAWPDPGGGILADGVTLLLAQHGPDPAKPPNAVAWDLDARTPSTAYPLPTAGLPGGLRVSSGGQYAALGSATGTVVIEPATNASRAVPGALHPVAVSPDGRTLLTADPTGVGVWDVASGTRRGEAHTGAQVFGAAFAPDGATFASLGANSRAAVWNTATLAAGKEFAAPAGGFVRFGADGRSLYTGGTGGLFAWDLTGRRGVGAGPAGTAPVTLACALAGRDLTLAEWQAVLPGRDYLHACPTG
jgi:DNA-binding winged helix-turn-helix (wHTH) protein